MKTPDAREFQTRAGIILCMGVSIFLGLKTPAAAQQSTVAVASATAPAEIKPAVSFNVLMVMFVDQAADAIWTAAVYPPKKNCEWEQVEYRATQLATTGTLLRVGGTGPRDMEWRSLSGWAPFADNMTQIALAAAQAARKKDVAKIKTAGDRLIDNCEGCHKTFKPDLPTQGIATHLTHATPLAKRLKIQCTDE
jgi:Cytochrome C'